MIKKLASKGLPLVTAPILGQPPRLRRSALFVPADKTRAIEKSRTLDADVLLFDLEDAVAPDNKTLARQRLSRALETRHWQCRERIVRINPPNTPAGQADIAALAGSPIEGILLPKAESPQQILQLLEALDKQPANAELPLWLMVETAAGVVHLESLLACSDRISCILIGSNDLAARLRLPITANRKGLLTALSLAILIARQYPVDILDGVYNHYQDESGLRQQCEQARTLGFDGKSLIHPSQITTANRCFTPDPQALQHATDVLAVEQAVKNHGVAVANGQLVEQLHIDEARRLLCLYQLSTRTA